MDHEDGDGDGAGLGGGVDGDSGGGWRRPTEVIPAGFPPSDLLRQQPSDSLFLVWCFSAASFWKTSGEYFYSRF